MEHAEIPAARLATSSPSPPSQETVVTHQGDKPMVEDTPLTHSSSTNTSISTSIAPPNSFLLLSPNVSNPTVHFPATLPSPSHENTYSSHHHHNHPHHRQHSHHHNHQMDYFPSNSHRHPHITHGSTSPDSRHSSRSHSAVVSRSNSHPSLRSLVISLATPSESTSLYDAPTIHERPTTSGSNSLGYRLTKRLNAIAADELAIGHHSDGSGGACCHQDLHPNRIATVSAGNSRKGIAMKLPLPTLVDEGGERGGNPEQHVESPMHGPSSLRNEVRADNNEINGSGDRELAEDEDEDEEDASVAVNQMINRELLQTYWVLNRVRNRLELCSDAQGTPFSSQASSPPAPPNSLETTPPDMSATSGNITPPRTPVIQSPPGGSGSVHALISDAESLQMLVEANIRLLKVLQDQVRRLEGLQKTIGQHNRCCGDGNCRGGNASPCDDDEVFIVNQRKCKTKEKEERKLPATPASGGAQRRVSNSFFSRLSKIPSITGSPNAKSKSTSFNNTTSAQTFASTIAPDATSTDTEDPSKSGDNGKGGKRENRGKGREKQKGNGWSSEGWRRIFWGIFS